MAWYAKTFRCGHSETVQLYGKMTRRERIVAAALEHDCPACRAQQAAAADAVAGLPALEGSEKQLGWGSECRIELIKLLDAQATHVHNLIARLDAGDANATSTPEKIADARMQAVAALDKIERIKGIRKAAYWIDSRTDTALMMMACAK